MWQQRARAQELAPSPCIHVEPGTTCNSRLNRQIGAMAPYISLFTCIILSPLEVDAEAIETLLPKLEQEAEESRRKEKAWKK